MYKNSKQTVLFPMLLAAGVALGILLGQYLGRHDRASEIRGMLTQMALPTNKLTYTLSLIENRYVDSVSMDSLAEHVIPMLVAELDPHSVYIPASEMQELNEPSRGSSTASAWSSTWPPIRSSCSTSFRRGRATGPVSRRATGSWRSTIRWSPGAGCLKTRS